MQQLSRNVQGIFKLDATGHVDENVKIKLKSIANQYLKINKLCEKAINVYNANYNFKVKKEYEIIINNKINKLKSLIKNYEDEIYKLINNASVYDKTVKDIYVEERKLMYSLSKIPGNPSLVELKKFSLMEILGLIEDTEEYLKKHNDER